MLDLRLGSGLTANRINQSTSRDSILSRLVLVRLNQQLAIDPHGPSGSRIFDFWLQDVITEPCGPMIDGRRRFHLGGTVAPLSGFGSRSC